MRRAALCFVLTTVLSLAPRALWAAPATQAVIAEVETALDQGDAQHAANLVDGALKDGVSAVERGRLLLYRGLAEELMGRPGDAMVDFSNALDSRVLPAGEREQALLQRGFLRDGLGELDSAAADYSAVIALKGVSLATAYNNRGNVQRRQGRLAPAQSDYTAALSAGGGKPQYSWYGLGQIAEARHDTQAARSDYARAAAPDPAYADAATRLAALGGAPYGAISGGTPIALHPPVPPPAPRRATRSAPVPIHASAASTAKPGLGLRPALDASRPGRDQGAEVQLGAWRSQAEAQTGWDRAKAKAGEALQGLSPVIVVADLPGKGRYYRLRTVPAAGQSRAALCDALTSKGVACLPARD